MESGLFEMQLCSVLMIVKSLYIFRFKLPSFQEIRTVIAICLPMKDVGDERWPRNLKLRVEEKLS